MTMVQNAMTVNTHATKRVFMFFQHMGATRSKKLTRNASRHAGNGQPGNGLKGVIRTRQHAKAVADWNAASARALGSESTEGKVSAEVGQLGKLVKSINQTRVSRV